MYWTVDDVDDAETKTGKIDEKRNEHEPEKKQTKKNTSSTQASLVSRTKQSREKEDEITADSINLEYLERTTNSEQRERPYAVNTISVTVIIVGAVVVRSCYTNKRPETMCSVLVFNFVH